MSVMRAELRAVPPNRGGPYGTVTFNDATGELTITGMAEQVMRRDREQVGDDAAFGAIVIGDGWSNGQLYLVAIS